MTHASKRFAALPRPARGLLAVGVALILAMLPPTRAAQAATTIVADRSAWFWMSNDCVTSQAAGTVSPGACVGSGAYGNAGANQISPGHLGVAMKSGEEDMRAYLHFNIQDVIPMGATIDSFVVTLTVSKKEQEHTAQHSTAGVRAPATLNDGVAAIKACLMRDSWADNVATGGGGDPPTSTAVADPTATPGEIPKSETTPNEPARDCSASVNGKASADGKTLSFDIASIAQKWVNGELPVNEGIALVPYENSVNSTWIVEVHGPAFATRNDAGQDVVIVPPTLAPRATVVYSGGEGPPPPPPPPPPVIDPGVVILPPVDPGTTPTDGVPVETPPVTGGTPTTTIVPVAFNSPTPGWLFGLFALGAMMLGWVWSMVGRDPLGLEPAAAGNNRVASVLHGRRVAGEETAASVTEAIAEEEFTELEH